MNKTRQFKRMRFLRYIAFALLGWVGSSSADYLGTENLRIFPIPLDDVIDGYDIGDRIEFVVEVTPRDTGSDSGNAAWSTFYVPPGVKVVGARYVTQDGSGYVTAAADPVDKTYDGWGSRGDMGYAAGLDEGFVNEVQQDTGIFYSTDSRTEQNFGLANVDGTGVAATQPFNVWDQLQTQAFGEDSAFSGNGGKGNTPLYDQGGGSYAGTGSPVAGPDAYYTNDYNPASGSGVDVYSGVGPWQRIETLGDSIGGSGPVTPATVQGAIINTAVDVTGGFQLDPVLVSGTPATSLPLATNAIRVVHGARRLGDLERWAVTFEITNVAVFLAELDAGRVCADSIPGDTTPAKDNNWRYYEVSRSCTNLNSRAVLVKEIISPVPAIVVSVGDIVTYDFTFYNLDAVPLTNVVATDEGLVNLTLVPLATAGCTAGSYDGVISSGGSATFTTIAGNIASWATIPSLPVGASVTYRMCGQVSGALASLVENEARIDYAGCTPAVSPCLDSKSIVPINNLLSGTVYLDSDGNGQFTSGETGIGGVIIDLYLDNGNGFLDAGDTFVISATTSSGGFYEFSSLTAGNYLIVENNLPLYTSTGDIDNTPLDCPTASATNNGCDQIGAITVGAADIITGRDFFDQSPDPDLRIVKTGSPNPVLSGQQLTYTLTITNIGAGNAEGVVVTDNLPAGLTWVSTQNSNAVPLCTTDDVEDCDCSDPDGADTGTITCEMGDIGIGLSETVVIIVTVD